MSDLEYRDAQNAAVPADDLIRHLLRRANAPVGVIDTRLAFRLHGRAGLWLGQRRELLAILKNRYGVAGDEGGGAWTDGLRGMPLQTTGASNFDAAPVPPSGSDAGNPETLFGTASQTSSEPEAQRFRVRRPIEPNLSKPHSSRTFSMQPLAAGAISFSANSVAAIHPQREPIETQKKASSAPDPIVLPPVRGGEANTLGQAEGKLAAEHDCTFVTNPLPQVSQLRSMPIAPEMPMAALAQASTADDLPGDKVALSDPYFNAPFVTNPLPQINQPRSMPIAPQMPMVALAQASTAGDLPVDKVALSNPYFNAPPVQLAATPIQIEQAPKRVDLHSQEALISKSPFVTLQPPHRLADQLPLVPTNSSFRTTETASALPIANAHSQGAISVEIRAMPSLAGSAAIVWREPERSNASGKRAATGPALAAGPIYASGSANSEAAAGTLSHSSLPVAMQASTGNRAEIAAVAEQVSRIIARQLRMERMRRGRTR
jgi:hypothetical protein